MGESKGTVSAQTAAARTGPAEVQGKLDLSAEGRGHRPQPPTKKVSAIDTSCKGKLVFSHGISLAC